MIMREIMITEIAEYAALVDNAEPFGFAPWEPCEHSACPAQALVYVPSTQRAASAVTLCGHHGDTVPGAEPLPGTWRVPVPVIETDESGNAEGGQETAAFV